ncbi:hypothetical protein FQN54_007190 [Arachnomyces sp. PD_36]|nr:hypothetical protein FQN54_007190 [Arachnomyces sp. PD_36]
MYKLLGTLLLTPLLASAASQSPKYCPLLGPVFPAPQNLNNNPTWQNLKQEITTTLHTQIQQIKDSPDLSSTLNFTSTSFALQIFSTTDRFPLLSETYTSEDAKGAEFGVRSVDEDTVFRIGSGSKLWTALLLLKEMGDGVLADPVSLYVPELAAAAADGVDDWVDGVRWDEITVGELVSHMAGIARDYGFLDLALQPDALEAVGFPELPKEDVPPCGLTGACGREDFFNGLLESHPIVPTGSTPKYSNAAYQILGYVIESATNRKFEDLFQEELVDCLGLSNSYYTPPNTDLGIIPVDPLTSQWAVPTGDETPAGGFFSTAHDMSTVGRAILNSTFLPPSTTRRWLKPLSHTTSPQLSIGAPWEIYSFQDPRHIDLYAKDGDLGAYSSILALSPDHDVGFTILAAGESASFVTRGLADVLGGILLPGLEEVARGEARGRFDGRYALAGEGSEISIVTDDDAPGLRIKSWMSNGKNVFLAFMPRLGLTDPSKLELRLYPTGLVSPGKISFRAVPVSLEEGGLASLGMGPITSVCTSWSSVGGQVYGNVGVDEFVFEVGEEGEVVGLSPRAMRVSLPRVEE